jgi:hypothetical protein
VCERNGAQAALSGSIAKLGNSYVITMDATECVSGKQLVKLQSQAKSREAVLQALGEISSKMRSKLGESLRSIHGFDVPIQQATTQSLDALVAYSKSRFLSMRGPFNWTPDSPWPMTHLAGRMGMLRT